MAPRTAVQPTEYTTQHIYVLLGAAGGTLAAAGGATPPPARGARLSTARRAASNTYMCLVLSPFPLPVHVRAPLLLL